MSTIIIVEDGTGSDETANSYIDAAYVDSYCSNLGLTSWASLATTAKENAILRGMDYIESLSFKGAKYDYTNPLKWPRGGATDEDGYAIDIDEIPNNLKKALARAAYEESVSTGVLQPTGKNNIKREVIAGAIETEYFGAGPSQKVFSVILGYLSGLLSAGGTKVIRG